MHKTALGNQAVVAHDERTVTCRYRDSRDHECKTMTLPAEELLRRSLQHVLPKGLHRVRAFGLLHPAHRNTLRRLQLNLGGVRDQPVGDPGAQRRCPRCRVGIVVLLRRLSVEESGRLSLVVASEPRTHCVGARAPP